MKLLGTVLLGVFAAGAMASDATVKETVYTSVIGEDVKAMCRQLGVPVPSKRLVLRSDNTCELSLSDKKMCGRYTTSKDSIALAFDGIQDLDIAKMNGDHLTLDGIEFEKFCAFTPGCWTVRKNGREIESIKFNFDQNGRFAFSGMGATSKGNWKLEGDCLVLVWSEIDGQPVEKGLCMQKRIALGQGGFDIDQYHYERQG